MKNSNYILDGVVAAVVISETGMILVRTVRSNLQQNHTTSSIREGTK